MCTLNSMPVAWATSKMRGSTDVLQESIFSCVLSVRRTQRTYFMSQNHRILIEWEIFEMNSSELNEPCHEIHQNSNSDNCHQETNRWDWLKRFFITDRRRKRNQRIIRYVAGHAVALLYYVNKPAVVREKFVKNLTGLPVVPVTEELNFFENEYSKNQLFHRRWYFH